MRAIIINHNTKLVSCLSLLSALKCASCPVTLIDCDSTDGSFDYFRSLQKKHSFDLVQMPLLTHGNTLDRIFTDTTEESLLLIDSDLEILNTDLIDFAKEGLKGKKVYGAGLFVNSVMLYSTHEMLSYYAGMLYHERPYVPLVLYKTAPIKEALQAGASFAMKMATNEFTILPKRLRYRAKKIFKTGFRKKIAGVRPAKIIYDTGALMDVHLKKMGYEFAGMPFDPYDESYFIHYQGATRRATNPNDNHVGKLIRNGTIEDIVTERLRSYEAMLETQGTAGR